ncbi:MAG TPA: Ig-like domain-containing protein [Longimicrobiaceae bacterium]|nr:Ig-like domain-containing protein [Longimicrobiaceae bacterium]
MNPSRFRTGRLQVTARVALAAAVLAAAAGCKDSTGPDRKVASVTVTAPAQTVEVGKTLQLSATAANSRGTTLTGKVFTWTSSSDAVARVDANGLVTGVAAGGPVTITASVEGRSGSVALTVTAPPPPPPPAVASVTVSPDTALLAVGATRQLTAVTRDAAGNVLTGRAVTWSTTNAGVAGVNASSGLVTAVASGTALVIADSEGKRDTATVTVFVPQAARVGLAPLFATADSAGTITFRAAGLTANGDTISGATVTWSSSADSVATVNASGTATGVSVGTARIVARIGTVADSATLAVLGARSLLSTALVGGTIRSDIRPGETITVPVTLDLSRVSSSGDLGSAQLDVVFDAAVLQYQSATPGVTGIADANLVSPGRVRFAFAGTAPQGSARLTLVTLTFRVAAGATVGTQRDLGLVYTARPTSTGFANYDFPVVVGGRIRVVAP